MLLFPFPGQSATFARFPVAAAGRLPQVARSALVGGYTVVAPASAELLAPETDAVPGQVWHRKILAGRLADPARPGEVNISFTLAEAAHLGVGDILRLALLTTAGHLARFSFRIVGIDAAPSEFPPQTGTGTDVVWATPAFYREHHTGVLVGSSSAFWLRHGPADLAAFQRDIYRLGHGQVALSYPLAEQAVNTEHSIHLQAVALWLLSGLLAVIGLLVLGQLLARLSFLDAVEYSTLLALGMSRRALLAVGLGRAAMIGAAGAVGGVLLAVLASAALPVGLAGIAEPHPGMQADGTVLGLAVAGAELAVLAAAAWPAWRAAAPGGVRSRAAAGAAARPGPAGSRAAGGWAPGSPGYAAGSRPP